MMRAMMIAAVVPVVFLLGASVDAGRTRDSKRTPVLVELFTSEGCSSCPPADEVLAQLVDDQPVPGARVIALGEHVDYWDELGWKDPFSAPTFTERQLAYVRHLGSSGPYTPQLVIGGREQAVGSDSTAARAAIAAVARSGDGSIALRVVSRSAGQVEITVEATWASGVAGDVLVAMVQDRATSTVTRGENAGRMLTHVAIARSIAVVGTGRGSFVGRTTVSAAPDAQRGRAVVFVQEPGGGRVRAVASLEL